MKKYVLITGASGGIGQATAKKLAKEGYSLYLHYYKNDKGIVTLLNDLQQFPGEYIPIKADLAKKAGYKKIAEYIFSLYGIVHNAGHSHYGMFVDLDESTLESLVQVHVTTPLLLTKELLPKMIQHRSGNIVVISSMWGQTGSACEVAYSAVKGAQISFVKALSKEAALNGIRVNGIAPGAIQTAMLSNFSKEELISIEENIPMGKIGNPENIADTVAFLLSEQSSYITGQIIAVNGGWYM
ncbi:SDR family oxidoreductase [Bacillus aquiflavi]|uniref:elongation factor P 5-aminopentanone reductase n=1 Tax=Bacillus aquiflavi TaxID=2672567 RepID=UPI001CAA3202|nr:SDR family oxidoreductase [Bacillus aquiflavi]UAC49437.1 SDR family oxidoreductase [Bacillus aquiflavi]